MNGCHGEVFQRRYRWAQFNLRTLLVLMSLGCFGLGCLKDFTQLLRLDLAGTRVTDAGLVHLANLSKLEELDLSGTQVTRAGIVELYGARGPSFFVRY